jgi:tetratricopeptide (TPR) repeat protein
MHHRHMVRTRAISPAPFARIVARIARGVVAVAALAALVALAPARSYAAPTGTVDAAPDPTIAAVSPADASAPASPSLAPRTPAVRRAAQHEQHPAAPQVTGPPKDLRHVSEWIAYRVARHVAALPIEARIFYRRGLIAQQSGQMDEALLNVRGASELDPSFVEPHLMLAAWMLTREPSQALQQYAVVVELLRQSFNLQLELAANAFLIAYQALFAGLLLAAMLVVWLRREDVTHVWRESLARYGTQRGSRWWAAALMGLPFLAGLGLTLPTLGFLAYLWPVLRARERALFVLLFAAVFAMPVVLSVSERFSLPLHEDAAPLYAVPALESSPYRGETEARLAAVATRQPDNALVQFGLGWTARRGGHLSVAEKAYRRVVELRPADDRAWNDLGNVLAMQGRGDDALACYRRAIEANPANAAASFNSAQIHTQRYDYAAATEALSRASALNFELVRNYQGQGTSDGLLPLIDQWLEPRVFWSTIWTATIPSDMAGDVPVGLRRHVEASGWPFGALVIVVCVLGFGFGTWQHRRLHLRVCSNCEAIVCRRCSVRRREHALCPACAATESQGETPEFSRVLLMRRRQARARSQRIVHTALAATLPGYGLLAHKRAFTPVFLLAATWLLARAWSGAAAPYALDPRLTLPGQEVPAVALVCGAVLVYAISLLGYFRLAEQERARELSNHAIQRGRVQQNTRRSFQTAA